MGQSRAGAFLIDITQPEGSRWRPRATHTPRERAREKIRFPTLAPAIKSFWRGWYYSVCIAPSSPITTRTHQPPTWGWGKIGGGAYSAPIKAENQTRLNITHFPALKSSTSPLIRSSKHFLEKKTRVKLESLFFEITYSITQKNKMAPVVTLDFASETPISRTVQYKKVNSQQPINKLLRCASSSMTFSN